MLLPQMCQEGNNSKILVEHIFSADLKFILSSGLRSVIVNKCLSLEYCFISEIRWETDTNILLHILCITLIILNNIIFLYLDEVKFFWDNEIIYTIRIYLNTVNLQYNGA